MAAATGTMLHEERRKLAEIKNLMTTFRGDYNWMPCGNIATKSDLKTDRNAVNGDRSIHYFYVKGMLSIAIYNRTRCKLDGV